MATHSDLARHTSKRLTHTQENTFYSKRTHSTVREHTSKRCLWLFFIRRWLLRTCFIFLIVFYFYFYSYFYFIFPAKRRGFSQMKTPPPWPFRLTHSLYTCSKYSTHSLYTCSKYAAPVTFQVDDAGVMRTHAYYRMCSLTTECVLLLWNDLLRMCFLTTECVLLLWNVFSYSWMPCQVDDADVIYVYDDVTYVYDDVTNVFSYSWMPCQVDDAGAMNSLGTFLQVSVVGLFWSYSRFLLTVRKVCFVTVVGLFWYGSRSLLVR